MASYFIQLPVIGGGGGGAVNSVNGYTGVVVLTKSDIGLSNVDNTSDLNKPISTATQTALNNKVEKSGDTMTGPLNMSALSENVQFSIYGLNATQGIEIKSDDDPTRPTGNVKLSTGDAINSDSAGSIYLEGGSNVNGNPSNIILTSGQSSGTGSDGVIILDSKGVVYLNQNPTGYIDAVNHQIINVSDPVSAQDAATKNWVENSSSQTSTLYVDSTASIFGADGSLLKPFTTIADALAVAVDFDVIIIRPGSYTEIQVVIPATINYLTIKGDAAISVNVTNGFSYTPSTATNVEINFHNINLNQVVLDLSIAINGLINVRQSVLSPNRIDTNASVVLNVTESTISGGDLYSTSIFNECLIIANANLYSPLTIFENCKFVTYVNVYDSSIARILNCELFGSSYFVNGIVGTSTPVLEIDPTSFYFGSYLGTCTVTVLANLTDYLKKADGGVITGPVEISSLPASPIFGQNLKLTQGDVGYQPEFLQIVKSLPLGSINNTPFYAIRADFNCSDPGLVGTIYLLQSSMNVPDVAGDVVYSGNQIYIGGSMNGYFCNVENYFNVGQNTGGTWDYYSRYYCTTHNSTLNGFDLSCNVSNMTGNVSGVNFTINSPNYVSGDVKIFDTDSNINFVAGDFTGVYMKPTISGTPTATTGILADMSSCSGGAIKAIKTIGDSEFTGNLLNYGDVEATGALKGQLNMQGSAPALSTDPGVAGDIRYDSGNLYVCIATNTWKKVALSTF